jgi:hypothetical protein
MRLYVAREMHTFQVAVQQYICIYKFRLSHLHFLILIFKHNKKISIDSHIIINQLLFFVVFLDLSIKKAIARSTTKQKKKGSSYCEKSERDLINLNNISKRERAGLFKLS